MSSIISGAMLFLPKALFDVFEVGENYFYFFLRPEIHFEVRFGARFRVARLEVLANEEERQEEKLEHIRNEKPEDERGERIELELGGAEDVPEKPRRSPYEYEEKESHTPDVFCYPECKPLERTQTLAVFPGHVPQGLPASFYFDKRGDVFLHTPIIAFIAFLGPLTSPGMWRYSY